VSDRFDDFVSGLVETAAASTAAPGPEAARKRAKQRRTRQRLSVSALSLALLCGAGGVAAAGLGHGTGTGTPVSVTGSSAPATPASSSPSSTAHSIGTGAPSDSALPSTSSGADWSTAPAPTPGSFDQANWLDALRAPLASSTISWLPIDNLYGKRIGGDVFEVTGADPSGSDGLSYFGKGCKLSTLSSTTSAQEDEVFNGYNDNAFLNNADQAIAASVSQLYFFYPDSSTAATAWNGIGSGFTACAGAETGVDPSTGTHITGTTSQTTSTADSQCWSNVTTGTSTPSGEGTSNHVCLVRHGDAIAALYVQVNFSKSAYLSTADYAAFDITLRQDLTNGLDGDLHAGVVPVCASTDLTMSWGQSGTYPQAAAGSEYRVMVFKNIGAHTCALLGFPVAEPVNSAGKPVPSLISQANLADPYDAKVYREAQIELAPGSTGSAILSWDSTAAVGACPGPGPNTFNVSAPGSDGTTSLGSIGSVCGPISVMPVQSGIVAP
jgi:hypothetical protein